MKIQELKSQGTFRLLLLSTVTYYVYPVHYLKRQTTIINRAIPPADQVSSAFVKANFVFAYLSLAFFIPYCLVPSGHLVEWVSGGADFVSTILILVWSFKVRNRLNSALEARSGYPSWFHGFWTFLFEHLYINYKINALCKVAANQEMKEIH